jgi:hypothetical protein
MQVTSGLICLIFSLGAHAAVQPTAWDFENGSHGWKPRAATVKLELVTGPGLPARSRQRGRFPLPAGSWSLIGKRGKPFCSHEMVCAGR